MEKLRSNRGETMIELLAAILVGTLSIALLFGAVMASKHMGRAAKEKTAKFYTSLSSAEAQKDTDKVELPAAKVTIAGNGAETTPNVTFYGGEDVVSYVFTP